MLLYETFYVVGRTLFPLLLDFRITGARHVPRTGPVLLVSNHRSYTDPVVIAAACSRPVHYLGKTELFSNPLFARLITALGCIPIRRDGYAANSIRQAVELLRAGKIVCVFPEGGLTTPGQLKPGVTIVAAQSRAPVVPVHLGGTQGMYYPDAYLLRARPIRVDVGKPILPEDLGGTSDRAAFQRRLMDALRRHLVRGEVE